MSTLKLVRPIIWGPNWECDMEVESGIYKRDGKMQFITLSKVFIGRGTMRQPKPAQYGKLDDLLALNFPEIADLTSQHGQAYTGTEAQRALTKKYGLRLVTTPT